MSKKFRPLHDRVLIKRLERESKTSFGLVIPESAAEKPDQGKVVRVGPGKRDESGRLVALDVQEGQIVLFGKYAGQAIKIDGEELLVMREDDIMGIIEG